MMLLQLFCFATPGGENQYGYGTEAEAHEYAMELVAEFSPSKLSPSADVRSDGIAFSIGEALAVLREGHETQS